MIWSSWMVLYRFCTKVCLVHLIAFSSVPKSLCVPACMSVAQCQQFHLSEHALCRSSSTISPLRSCSLTALLIVVASFSLCVFVFPPRFLVQYSGVHLAGPSTPAPSSNLHGCADSDHERPCRQACRRQRNDLLAVPARVAAREFHLVACV